MISLDVESIVCMAHLWTHSKPNAQWWKCTPLDVQEWLFAVQIAMSVELYITKLKNWFPLPHIILSAISWILADADVLYPRSHLWCAWRKCSGRRRPQPLSSMYGSLFLWLRCLLIKGQAKMKRSIFSEVYYSLDEDTTNFLFSLSSANQHHDWVFSLLLQM